MPSGSFSIGQETYFYNKRLQMAVGELGTSTGTNDNGNVGGYFHGDNANSGSLSHNATYHYDAVKRLSTAVATGNIGYNQTCSFTGEASTAISVARPARRRTAA